MLHQHAAVQSFFADIKNNGLAMLECGKIQEHGIQWECRGYKRKRFGNERMNHNRVDSR